MKNRELRRREVLAKLACSKASIVQRQCFSIKTRIRHGSGVVHTGHLMTYVEELLLMIGQINELDRKKP